MVVDATYTSVWDGGLTLSSPCKVNTKTMQITKIKDRYSVNVEVLEDEYVEFNGEKHPCAYEDLVFDMHKLSIGEKRKDSKLENCENKYWYK